MIKALLLLVACHATVAHRWDTALQSANGTITLHFATMDYVLEHKAGAWHGIANGDPATIVDSGSGTTIMGQKIDATAIDLGANKKSLQSAAATGKATILLDDSIAYETKAANAKKAGKTLPVPDIARLMQANSDSFVYTVDKSVGTLDIPTTWTYKGTSKGTVIRKEKDKDKVTILHVAFTENLDADGVKGHFIVDLEPDGTYKRPKQGVIEGRVHFKMVRVEATLETKEVSTQTVIGSSDRLIFDFTTTPGTIKAVGNVVLDGTGDGLIGHTVCEEFTTVVDADLQPISYSIKGNQAASKVNTKDGSR